MLAFMHVDGPLQATGNVPFFAGAPVSSLDSSSFERIIGLSASPARSFDEGDGACEGVLDERDEAVIGHA
ncbi:MAG: hypothetical protein QGH76_04065, partial [Phycisphaerales bacterium]|nr:hypothetical protein [Phycisphaerales bacterium]